MRKWIALIVFLLAAVGIYSYLYQAHRVIQNENSDFIITSSTFIDEFIENPAASEQKYLNKVVEVSGIITEINSDGLMLSNKIYCILLDSIKNAHSKIQTQITIKGRIIGFDDLLEEIKLDQCYILK